MIKREQKLLFKQIEKFTQTARPLKERRALHFQDHTRKLKIPKEIYEGMRKKTLARMEEVKHRDKKVSMDWIISLELQVRRVGRCG